MGMGVKVRVKNWLTSMLGINPSYSLVGLQPGARYDYGAGAGRRWDNAVVATGVQFLATSMAEAPLIVETRAKSASGDLQWDAVPDHPLRLALDYANEWYDESALWMGTMLSWVADGNAYWLKLRNKTGAVVGFIYVPHTQIEPKHDRDNADGSKLVTHYWYTPPGSGAGQAIERSEVVHFRNGIHPERPWLGLSPVASVLRQICGDNDVATYTAALMRNMGVTGTIFIPKEDIEIGVAGPEQQQQFKQTFQREMTGEGAGGCLIAPFPMSITNPGKTPQDLMVDKVDAQFAADICAAMGFDPMALNLPSQSKTYSNYEEAKRAAYTSVVMPTKRILGQQLTKQCLMPDFQDRASRVGWDYSQVRALEDDKTALWGRVSDAYAKGVIKRAVALSQLGLDFAPEDEVYIQDVMLGSVAAGGVDQAKAMAAQNLNRRKRLANRVQHEWVQEHVQSPNAE